MVRAALVLSPRRQLHLQHMGFLDIEAMSKTCSFTSTAAVVLCWQGQEGGVVCDSS